MITLPWWVPTLIGIITLVIGYALHIFINRIKADGTLQTARQAVKDAQTQADSILKDAELKAKDIALNAREGFEDETRLRRQELKTLDERIGQRETNLERKVALLDKKEEGIDAKLAAVEQERVELQTETQRCRQLAVDQEQRIQDIAGMTSEQARTELMTGLEEELKVESGALIRRIQEEAKEQAEREARKIITQAVERYAADQVNEITTCAVSLPSDEMKGRIIGREGRNIRSLESLTGVNVLIDDTPETVVISGFDPLRREVAKIALERLVNDGRIHPARIEEIVGKVQEEIDETIREAGEKAIYELDVRSVAPELVRTLGRLKFRHSYSQNILRHSLEMGHIMGMMASELGLDPVVAKRCGLFHDIGKALTHEVEGSHALIGADLLKRHGEDPVVVNAVASHHGDVEQESLYAMLVVAADAMTAARPGARSETTDIYIKRLEQLEAIATGFRGVEKCFAMQAGRELRVIVGPSKINDDEAMQMARNISKQIEEQVKYPGQIKVTVVRETRCIEYAR